MSGWYGGESVCEEGKTERWMTDKAVYSNDTISNFKEKLLLGDVQPLMEILVHSYINQSMKNTVDLKLLGRKIGFNALMNQAIALWMTNWKVVGKVIKIDFNIDFGSRGRFARMAMCINLDEPLVSKIHIKECLQ
ncbi:hypothetical protein Gotri_022444 [Gossypium trilobum]|uniref:DUF4283 domain-containing protein n=1 Tax=Gossypium trilobum TaxID=34281 RepID=A0A7J9DFZ2_9ROSI|nr:hypothetical protein [Gossypium trilobum]